MADNRAAMATLEEADGTAKALAEMQEGDNPSTKSGAIGFSFKDNAGLVVLPTLNPDGSIPVDTGGSGTPKKARGEITAGSPEATFVDVASIPLTAGKAISCLDGVFSTRQGGYFQVYHVDDPAGTPVIVELADIVLDAGQHTFSGLPDCLDFTSGATAPELRVRAYNWGTGAGKLSALRATLCCKEAA